MEASQAGLAASDGQQQGDAQNGEGQGDANAQMAQQIESLANTLPQLQQSQEQMREYLQSNPWAPQDETQEEPQVADLSFLDESSPQYDPNAVAQRLSEVMKQEASTEAERLMQEKLAPIQAQVQEMKSQQGADELAAEFPELKDAKVAQQVIEHAEQQAQILGHPELVGNFQFVRQVYLMGRAMQLSQEQRGDGAPAATLEGAGGASPGAQGATPTADSVTSTWGQNQKLLPF